MGRSGPRFLPASSPDELRSVRRHALRPSTFRSSSPDRGSCLGAISILAVGICLLTPASAARVSPFAVLITGPYHGSDLAMNYTTLQDCGSAVATHVRPFSLAKGMGADANLSSIARSCATYPAGGQNVESFDDIVNLKFHGVNGTRVVVANFSLGGSGGIRLRSGGCARGNATNWSCDAFAQSASDYAVFLWDLRNGTFWIANSNPARGGQTSTWANETASCTVAGGCVNTSNFETCTVAGGCHTSSSRSFPLTWNWTSSISGVFDVSGMLSSHVYELQVWLIESTWVGCQNQGAYQLGCRAHAWVGPGPTGIGLDISSITIR
jgi:hypothetical protein